eukprot:GHVN01023167.1.p1 GENE.GHVN01023167.1~~GHVN01023167.1.p1  ORF type:complete len:368 (+),score=23.26 GHVN01023167.1:109-1212(+)
MRVSGDTHTQPMWSRSSLATILFILSGIGALFVVTQMFKGSHRLVEHIVQMSSDLPVDDCKVTCSVGVPCEYEEEVDFRIIVLTLDRPESLRKCLESLSHVDTMGKNAAVDIWIDRHNDTNIIDRETLRTAELFQSNWRKGRTCIHQREKNAYIDGQWIDTWRPKVGAREIALILEDDVDVSPHALRWLELAHKQYDNMPDVAGITLQMQWNTFFEGKKTMGGPPNDNVFLYGVLGSWGFSPHPERWREFQDWFHTINSSLKPYVPNIKCTGWYKGLEKNGKARSMWTMHHVYHSHINKLYTVYCNLRIKFRKEDLLLSYNRKEKGLHFKKPRGKTQSTNLMRDWNLDYGVFPEQIVRLAYDGSEAV